MAFQRTAPSGPNVPMRGDYERGPLVTQRGGKRWLPILLIAIGTLFIALALLSRFVGRAETPPPPPTEYRDR
jgi:hypothetical protein